MAYIIHYSHATFTFEDHHVLRAVDENECFRPDLTVFNHWETAVTKKYVVFVPLYTLLYVTKKMLSYKKNCNILSTHYK